MRVLNLGNKPATAAQREQGLVDLSVEERARLNRLIDEVSMSTVSEILESTLQAAGLIQQWALSNECEVIFIGQLDFMGDGLVQLLEGIELKVVRYLSAKMQLAGEARSEKTESMIEKTFTKSQIRGSWLKVTQWEFAY